MAVEPFVRAVRAALHGGACVTDRGQPCAALPEMFVDEFARYACGFAVSMTYYRTPPLLDATTFGELLGTPARDEEWVTRPADEDGHEDGHIVQIRVRADAANVREDRGIAMPPTRL